MTNITKLKLVYFFSSLYFYTPILTLFYLSRGVDLFQIVSLEAVLVAAIVFAEVPTGIIADRIGRKFSLSMQLLLVLLTSLWLIYAHSYLEFVLISSVFGIGVAFASGAVEALVYDSLKAENREKEMDQIWGSISSYSLVGSAIAVTVGGYLAQDHQPETFTALI